MWLIKKENMLFEYSSLKLFLLIYLSLQFCQHSETEEAQPGANGDFFPDSPKKSFLLRRSRTPSPVRERNQV